MIPVTVHISYPHAVSTLFGKMIKYNIVKCYKKIIVVHGLRIIFSYCFKMGI